MKVRGDKEKISARYPLTPTLSPSELGERERKLIFIVMGAYAVFSLHTRAYRLLFTLPVRDLCCLVLLLLDREVEVDDEPSMFLCLTVFL